MQGRRVPAEGAAAGLVLLTGGAAVYGALRLGIGTFTSPEPGFFPLLAALLLVALSGMELARTAIGRSKAKDPPDADSSMRPALAAMAALCVYVPVLDWLGYLIATALLVAALLAVFQIRNPITYLLAVPLISGGSYLLFHVLLSLPLPTGSLGI